jgi:hypothetical protein
LEEGGGGGGDPGSGSGHSLGASVAELWGALDPRLRWGLQVLGCEPTKPPPTLWTPDTVTAEMQPLCAAAPTAFAPWRPPVCVVPPLWTSRRVDGDDRTLPATKTEAEAVPLTTTTAPPVAAAPQGNGGAYGSHGHSRKRKAAGVWQPPQLL